MKILLTGSRGYIGTVMAPFLVRAGHEVVGVDTDLYRRSSFGEWKESIETRGRTCARSRQDLPDSTRSSTSPRSPTIRWAISTPAHLRHQPPRLGAPGGAGQGGRGAALRSSPPRAATTAPPGEDPVNETAELNPVTAVRRVKVRVERDVAKLADDAFSPTFLRCATAYGVSPRLRFDIVLNNLVAWAFTSGKVMLKSDGTPWRPIVHIEDISRAFLAVLGVPRERVHARPSTSARTTRTTASGRSPTSSRRRSRAARSPSPTTPVPTSATTGPTSQDRAAASRVPAAVGRAEGSEAALRRLPGHRPVLADFEGPRYRRIDQIKR